MSGRLCFVFNMNFCLMLLCLTYRLSFSRLFSTDCQSSESTSENDTTEVSRNIILLPWYQFGVQSSLWLIILKNIIHIEFSGIQSKWRDICRRNAGLCKQQPNLAPIQRERERVILRWKYLEDSRWSKLWKYKR